MDGIADVAANLAAVRDRIRTAGGDPVQVTVVAVTKGFGDDAVEAAVAAGATDLGENYAAELAAKWRPGVRWHFLGAIQRNKVRSPFTQSTDVFHVPQCNRAYPGGCKQVLISLVRSRESGQ